MDSTALPIIGPAIDYTKVRSLHQKRTLAFNNHFINTTVSLLNQFTRACEFRLMKFEAKLLKLEASLSILEAQLGSIPGLSEILEKREKDEPTNEPDQNPNSNQRAEPEPNPNQNPELDVNVPFKGGDPKSVSKIKISQDPRYEKFFRMINFGVPLDAVKLKMQIEGLEPSLLDNPDAEINPSPKGVVQLSESENSSSSFSD